MLYRAICYDLARDNADLAHGESIVFVEAFSRDEAKSRLHEALAIIWHTTPTMIEFYNLEDEVQLVHHAESEKRDHRFFETGFGGGHLSYVTELPVFLVRPPMHARLTAAFNSLPYLGNPSWGNAA